MCTEVNRLDILLMVEYYPTLLIWLEPTLSLAGAAPVLLVFHWNSLKRPKGAAFLSLQIQKINHGISAPTALTTSQLCFGTLLFWLQLISSRSGWLIASRPVNQLLITWFLKFKLAAWNTSRQSKHVCVFIHDCFNDWISNSYNQHHELTGRSVRDTTDLASNSTIN
jgi:hypothetical protein